MTFFKIIFYILIAANTPEKIGSFICGYAADRGRVLVVGFLTVFACMAVGFVIREKRIENGKVAISFSTISIIEIIIGIVILGFFSQTIVAGIMSILFCFFGGMAFADYLFGNE